MKKISNINWERYLFVCGIIIILISYVPYIILGERSIITYHDQLDGELIGYIYQAKYLFSVQNVIPEFLCGASKTALIPPAPLLVLLFCVLPPFWALLLAQIIGQVIGYAGMFWLSSEFTEKKLISFLVALLYTFIPFLPVYGLSQYGMPLMLLCMLHIYNGKNMKWSIGYVALYAMMSSLILCGFAWLFVWGVILVILAFKKKWDSVQNCLYGFLVLLGIYIIENFRLLLQLLGVGDGVLSHKKEYVLSGDGFWSSFWNYIQYNSQHCVDNHIWIVYLAVVLFVGLTLVKKWRRIFEIQYKYMAGTLVSILILVIMSALWECPWGIAIRNMLGVLGSFQLSRFLWLTPVLWYLVLVFCLDVLWSLKGKFKRLVYIISFCWLGCMSLVVFKDSFVKTNVQKLINGNYNAISYADYLAIDVMEQVDEFILQTEGLQKEQYRVASLGIDPAAALYHGFYTVDGYSNNYDLSYKHEFRKVISAELEKNEYIKMYYDDWGNRCYLFSSECPGYYTIEKGGFVFNKLELNTAVLKELGCEYILSAAYIMNPEDNRLVLLNEKPIETQDSYYKIYVYKIETNGEYIKDEWDKG